MPGLMWPPGARLLHVSADAAACWYEVDLFHPELEAAGYSLHEADSDSVQAFTHLFGVAVAGNRRIAHGMFALENGVITVADIPLQQMGVPSIGRFMRAVLTARQSKSESGREVSRVFDMLIPRMGGR
jgi:hypothetical protein